MASDLPIDELLGVVVSPPAELQCRVWRDQHGEWQASARLYETDRPTPVPASGVGRGRAAEPGEALRLALSAIAP